MSDEITQATPSPTRNLQSLVHSRAPGYLPAHRSQAPWNTAREAVPSRSLSPTPKDWLLKRRVPI